MVAKLAKWGNSVAVRLPKAILSQAGLKTGDRLEVSLDQEGNIVIKPPRRKYSLSEMVAGITKKNQHPETDWGGPAGREIW